MASILLGNIKGPKGDTGPQGQQGEVGPVGPQGPLPTLVNNALATTPGVAALDAAMGKTLQDHIDTTNSNLIVSKVTYGWGFLFKYGKLRTLDILGVVSLGANIPILTLSTSDKPNDTIFAPLVYGSPYVLGSIRISANGEITLRNNSDVSPEWSDTFFRGQISWYVS